MDERKLSHEALEQLRINAVLQVEPGESPEQGIKAIGFERVCIFRWIAKYRFGGIEVLKSRKAACRPPILDGNQLMKLFGIIKNDIPEQYEFPFALWTVAIIRIVIKRVFTISMSEVVDWAIEETESDDHARRLFARVTRDLGVYPEIVHADNGNSMRGVTLVVFLDSLKVSRSYSRPRCSNDNAFMESWYKTLKYTVGYPRFFASIEQARIWFADFVNWYNNNHLYSALGYVTPTQRRSGAVDLIYAIRNQTIAEAQSKNPSRWRNGKTRSYGSSSVMAVYRPISQTA